MAKYAENLKKLKRILSGDMKCSSLLKFYKLVYDVLKSYIYENVKIGYGRKVYGQPTRQIQQEFVDLGVGVVSTPIGRTKLVFPKAFKLSLVQQLEKLDQLDKKSEIKKAMDNMVTKISETNVPQGCFLKINFPLYNKQGQAEDGAPWNDEDLYLATTLVYAKCKRMKRIIQDLIKEDLLGGRGAAHEIWLNERRKILLNACNNSSGLVDSWDD